MIRQFELVDKVKAYDPDADEDILNRAYVYAMKAHGTQVRASGQSYFSHPLEVAGILTDYKLDTASIVTALLHDVVEDTTIELEEVRDHFGPEVAQLVDGVTKLARIEFQSDQAKQAENFRKLVLAMSEDIRVLLVKLADRLHNMRTLRYIRDPEKRRRIARETMDIYAPLAERIGMERIKSELEDLAFAELNPEGHNSIVARLKFLREKGGDVLKRIMEHLGRTLHEADIVAEISGREKSPYSIWRKTQQKNTAFEQLSDVMAFRVVVDTLGECYRALGAVHGAYRVVPGRFKDYISTPKPNGYRSLHTGVFGPERQRIEIQIRTREMHMIAEHGVAAHWIYKQGADRRDGRQYRWVRQLLDVLENADGPEEFLEHTKLEMFRDQVFCFTPRGDLITLPIGATPVDFAYAVHSDIGNTCVGAKINGRMMPLRTELANGDQVEVVTSKAQTPSPAWERFAVTGKARAEIRRFIRSQERTQYLHLGRSILARAFKEEDYEYSDKALAGVLKNFDAASVEDLIAAVGAGHHTHREIIEAVFPAAKRKRGGWAKVVSLAARARPRKTKQGPPPVPIRGLIPGMAMHFAGCCHPLPGDRIVGIVASGKGVTIHAIDCDKLEEFADEPGRWIDVAWDAGKADAGVYVGRVKLTVMNVPGSLGDLSTMIAKNDGNISNLNITNRSADFFDMTIDIEVKDLKHLNDIISALRAMPAINTVERARG